MNVARGLLALALCAAAPAAAQSAADSAALALLKRSATVYQGGRTLRAEFTQTLVNPRTRTEFTAAGEFFQRGSTRFAFRYSEPPEDRVVSDGTFLWLYTPSITRGQVIKLPPGAGAGLDIASSVLKDPERRYTVTAAGDTTIERRAVRAVRLVPKAQGAPFLRAVLWVDVRSALVRRAEFSEATGGTRIFTFTNLRTGVPLPADAFVFTPPEGVKVIDPAAALGGPRRP